MKAVIYEEYGPPEVLRLTEVPKPAPNSNEILIKVHAVTVTATDCIFRSGAQKMARLFTGVFKPKNKILGSEFAGEVVECGENVAGYKTGDRVFGTLPGAGAYAEFITLDPIKSTLAFIPEGLSYAEAAATNDSFLTALPFLRDKGLIKAGQKVLVNGASGGVGSAGVQWAKYFGAHVTAVCSASNFSLVQSLGADEVIDYTKTAVDVWGGPYDIIFDAVGKLTFSQVKGLLTDNGRFLNVYVSPAAFPDMIRTSLFGKKKMLIMATGLRKSEERSEDLRLIANLFSEGKLKPVMDRTFEFEEIVEAHRYVDTGHKRGNVAVLLS